MPVIPLTFRKRHLKLESLAEYLESIECELNFKAAGKPTQSLATKVGKTIARRNVEVEMPHRQVHNRILLSSTKQLIGCYETPEICQISTVPPPGPDTLMRANQQKQQQYIPRIPPDCHQNNQSVSIDMTMTQLTSPKFNQDIPIASHRVEIIPIAPHRGELNNTPEDCQKNISSVDRLGDSHGSSESVSNHAVLKQTGILIEGKETQINMPNTVSSVRQKFEDGATASSLIVSKEPCSPPQNISKYLRNIRSKPTGGANCRSEVLPNSSTSSVKHFKLEIPSAFAADSKEFRNADQKLSSTSPLKPLVGDHSIKVDSPATGKNDVKVNHTTTSTRSLTSMKVPCTVGYTQHKDLESPGLNRHTNRKTSLDFSLRNLDISHDVARMHGNNGHDNSKSFQQRQMATKFDVSQDPEYYGDSTRQDLDKTKQQSPVSESGTGLPMSRLTGSNAVKQKEIEPGDMSVLTTRSPNIKSADSIQVMSVSAGMFCSEHDESNSTDTISPIADMREESVPPSDIGQPNKSLAAFKEITHERAMVCDTKSKDTHASKTVNANCSQIDKDILLSEENRISKDEKYVHTAKAACSPSHKSTNCDGQSTVAPNDGTPNHHHSSTNPASGYIGARDDDRTMDASTTTCHQAHYGQDNSEKQKLLHTTVISIGSNHNTRLSNDSNGLGEPPYNADGSNEDQFVSSTQPALSKQDHEETVNIMPGACSKSREDIGFGNTEAFADIGTPASKKCQPVAPTLKTQSPTLNKVTEVQLKPKEKVENHGELVKAQHDSKIGADNELPKTLEIPRKLSDEAVQKASKPETSVQSLPPSLQYDEPILQMNQNGDKDKFEPDVLVPADQLQNVGVDIIPQPTGRSDGAESEMAQTTVTETSPCNMVDDIGKDNEGVKDEPMRIINRIQNTLTNGSDATSVSHQIVEWEHLPPPKIELDAITEQNIIPKLLSWSEERLGLSNVDQMLGDLGAVNENGEFYESLVKLHDIIKGFNVDLRNMFDNYICFEGDRDENQMKRFLQTAHIRANERYESSGLNGTCLSRDHLKTVTDKLVEIYRSHNKQIIEKEERLIGEVIEKVADEYKSGLQKYDQAGTNKSGRDKLDEIHKRMRSQCTIIVGRSTKYGGKLNNVMRLATMEMATKLDDHFKDTMEAVPTEKHLNSNEQNVQASKQIYWDLIQNENQNIHAEDPKDTLVDEEFINRKMELLGKCDRMETQIIQGSVSVGRLTKKIILEAIRMGRLAADEDMIDGAEAREVEELFNIHHFS